MVPQKFLVNMRAFGFTAALLGGGQHKQLGDALSKVILRCNQAHHAVAVTGKIIEMPRMEIDSFFLKQLNRQFFIRPDRRYPDNRVPAALNFQAAARALQTKLPVQLREVLPYPCSKLLLK